jgi:predicted dienelactone hydrolase
MIAENILFDGFAAQESATLSTLSTPVVIFSHGSGGKAVQAGWLASQLATQGMIVVAPNHQGTMSQDSDPFQTPMIWQRTKDLSATLDALENGALGDFTPDMERVAAMGFSLGGGAALTLAGAQLSKADFITYCAEPEGTPDCDWMQAGGVDFGDIDQALYEADWSDPRISSVIAIDPALTQAMTADSLDKMTLPTLTIGLGNAETVPLAANAYHLQGRIEGAEHTWIPQSAHFSFLPSCSVIGKIATSLIGDDNICSDWGLRNRDAVHTDVLAEISSFLEHTFVPPS